MIGKKARRRLKASAASIPRGVVALSQYITAPHDGAKCVYIVVSGMLGSMLQSWQLEMQSLASESRSKFPFSHFILSWPEGEHPTPAQVDQALEITLKHLGLTGHQAIAALHRDTDNDHLHLMVNRVHPVTLLTVEVNRGFDDKAIQQAAAIVEKRQNWSPAKNGRWTVADDGSVHLTGETKSVVRPQIREIEAASGVQTTAGYGTETVLPLLTRAITWPDLHQSLAAIGARYERKGSGALVWIGDEPVKASTVSPGASLSKMQKRLGQFQPPLSEKPHEYVRHLPDSEPTIGGRPFTAAQLSAYQSDIARGGRRLVDHRVLDLSERFLAARGQENTSGVLPSAPGLRGSGNPPMRRVDGPVRISRKLARASQDLWDRFLNDTQRQKEVRAAALAKAAKRHAAERLELRNHQKVQWATIMADARAKNLTVIARSELTRMHRDQRARLAKRHLAARARIRTATPVQSSYLRWLIYKAWKNVSGRFEAEIAQLRGRTGATARPVVKERQAAASKLAGPPTQGAVQATTETEQPATVKIATVRPTPVQAAPDKNIRTPPSPSTTLAQIAAFLARQQKGRE